VIRKNCSTYCPPHCEFEPDYCAPIDCPDGPICTELIPSDAIIFEGTYLECFGITAGMNLTDVVLALAALVFPQCNTTTTTSTTTTTTLCQRPTGLTNIILVSSFDDGTTLVEFSGTFAEACTASNLIINNSSYFLNTYVGQVSSLGTTGVTVYDTSFLTDCNVVPDGFYVDAADYTQIINIVGGVLVSISACTITTTTSTTTTSGPCVINKYGIDVTGGDWPIVYDLCGQSINALLLANGYYEFCASSILSLDPSQVPFLIGPCPTTGGTITFRVVNNLDAIITGFNPPVFILDPGNSFPVTLGSDALGTLSGIVSGAVEIYYDSPTYQPIINIIVNGTSLVSITSNIGIGQVFRYPLSGPWPGWTGTDTVIIEINA
jgi:hypothetical protein